jgi:membrane protease YdiL (CAAX protease family)
MERIGRFTALWALGTVVLSVALLQLQSTLPILSMDVLSLVMLAPALAAGIALLLVRRSGWPGIVGGRPLPPRAMTWQILAACAFALVCFLAIALFTGTPGSLPSSVASVPLLVMLALQVLGALGEEIGYRGVLLAVLLHRLPRPLAVLLAGLAFGLVHIQYWAEGPVTVLWFLVATIALVTAMSMLWRGSAPQRIATTTLMHAGVNVGLFAVSGAGPVAMPAFAGGVVIATLALALILRLARPVGAERGVPAAA